MYCQTMFGVSRDVMLIGLQTMEAEKLTHYDIHCPKCRRANRVERRRLELANPNWQASLTQIAKEAAKAEKEQAAAETAKPAAKSKESSAKKTTKASASKEKPATKKSPAKSKASAAKKPAAKSPSKAKGK